MSPRPHRHLLRVRATVETFTPLLAAARDAGLRIGWLTLAAVEGVPPVLSAAADHGVLRAVSIGGGRAVAVKPMRGPAVPRDVLREYFRGCALVLVDGDLEAPALTAGADGAWRIETLDGDVLTIDTETLLARLRRPRPWGDERR